MALPGLEFAQVQVGDVARAIQLSLTPVFLLNGVGVLLAMLTTRLARIVDRARTLEERLPTASVQGAHDIHTVLREDIVPRAGNGGGLTWHLCRPPIEGLEYEMDVRGVSVERVLDR